MEGLFWAAVALIVYTHMLFPALVLLRGMLIHRPYKSAEITPYISVIIAAHNEARTIGAKLDNILTLDYPRDCLEVLIVSDGSNDGTDAIVQRYASHGIKLISLPRGGKACALNAAVTASAADILVFSDANSMFAPSALRALVRPFADPDVGGVAGNQCYLTEQGNSPTSDGEHIYWNFDRRLKHFQSQAGSATSATGAIYATRRSLFRTIPPGVTDDFVTSTSVIAQGYRLIFASQAIAYEPAAASTSVEFSRKVRLMTRGLRATAVMRELLNPFRYGFYAIQLFSHKILRRLVVFPLLALLLVSPLLWHHGLPYQSALVLQLSLYSSATLGGLLAKTRFGRAKLLSVPFFFVMGNAAALVATWNVLQGRRIDRWQPQRHDANTDAADVPQQEAGLSVFSGGGHP